MVFSVSAALALIAALARPTHAGPDESHECSTRTLRGVYLFHASGYNIVNGVAVPKAVIQKGVFDGEGNVSTPAISLSINGIILQPAGAPGTYTVDADCTGTMVFADAAGNKYSLQITPTGDEINMLQTTPNTVFQGTAKRVSRLDGEHEQH